MNVISQLDYLLELAGCVRKSEGLYELRGVDICGVEFKEATAWARRYGMTWEFTDNMRMVVEFGSDET